MSLRLEMLQVARLAPKLLGDSTSLVVDFLHRQQAEDGGFKDRTGRSDLYYTVFGLDGLIALQAEVPVEPTAQYLETSACAERLDFVHLCCLARCRAALTGAQTPGNDTVARLRQSHVAEAILVGIESHRTPDGGYNAVPHEEAGTAYGCYFALGRTRIWPPDRLIRALDRVSGRTANAGRGLVQRDRPAARLNQRHRRGRAGASHPAGPDQSLGR